MMLIADAGIAPALFCKVRVSLVEKRTELVGKRPRPLGFDGAAESALSRR
jgi:hypothetical protein